MPPREFISLVFGAEGPLLSNSSRRDLEVMEFPEKKLGLKLFL